MQIRLHLTKNVDKGTFPRVLQIFNWPDNGHFRIDMANQESKELSLARDIIEQTGVNLFLTGKAGTGKTTFLRQLSESTSKRHVILAPTGVAAINAGGSTIHSFFQLPFAPFVPGSDISGEKKFMRFGKEKLRLIRTIDLVIIDEISMVRPDVLDAIDDVLRRFRNPLKPFGGVQLLMIGDLRQLAPVAIDSEWSILSEYYSTPYFFESRALREAGFLTVELTKVFRQSDRKFLSILNAIRENRVDDAMLAALNRRADRTLFPADDSGYIRLTTHNARANAVNEERLRRLPGDEFVYESVVTGNFPESAFPADQFLVLKKGAQVMFVKNDTVQHAYYNGLIGEVIALDRDGVTVRPRTPGMPDVKVGKESWQNIRYALGSDGSVKEVVEGVFSQVPLRTAWAITIHKSQGLTFEKAIVDASRSFASGQTYVALSRCRSLEGLLLDSPLPASAVMVDRAVSEFIYHCDASTHSDEAVERYKQGYYADLLKELFDFRLIGNSFDLFLRDAFSVLQGDYPNYVASVDAAYLSFKSEVADVQSRLYVFLNAAVPHIADSAVKNKIDVKVRGGCSYFLDKLCGLRRLCSQMPKQTDNAALRKRIRKSQEALLDLLSVKIKLLEAFEHREFGTLPFLKIKAQALLDLDGGVSKAPRVKSRGVHSEKRKVQTDFNSEDNGDIKNPKLYAALCEWRKAEAGTAPAFTVLSNRCLLALSAYMPHDKNTLLDIPGIGKKKLLQYGDALLEIIGRFREN